MDRIVPNWDLWRSFEAVMRTGSLSAASRALALTQPTVGRHIDELETALGTGALFVRSGRGLVPTPLALALQPHAVSMASASRALEREAAARPDAVVGPVRVSASEVIAVEVLPPALARLHEAHPGLSIELEASNSNADLLRRDADVAVRMSVPGQQALVTKRVGRISLGLWAHRDYLLRAGVPECLEDLADHAVIGYDREIGWQRMMTRALGPAARFAGRTDNTLAQLALVRGGFGIGVVQDTIAVRTPALESVLEDVFALRMPTWIVMHEDLRSTRRMRVVFDALVEAVSAHARAGRS